MRAVLVLLAVLVAGCSASQGDRAAEMPEPAVERVGTQAVEGHLTSSVYACPPAGYCIGVMGSDTMAFEGRVWTALNVTFHVDAEPDDQVLSSLNDVRFVALCLGEHLTCPEEPLAVADGPGPVHLSASGFRIEEPNLLAFRVESASGLPAGGSGAGYWFAGTLTYVDGSGPSDDGGDA